MDDEFRIIGDTKWTIKLYPTIMEALSKKLDEVNLPGVSNFSEITGCLTEDKRGLLLPGYRENENKGFFIIPAASVVENKEVKGAPDYITLHDLTNFDEILSLIYFDDSNSEPKIVGFFYKEDWSESDYFKNKTTSATFRIRTLLLEEFKQICSEKDLSQTEIISNLLWNFNRNIRTKGKDFNRFWDIVLPDGTVWPPQPQEDF